MGRPDAAQQAGHSYPLKVVALVFVVEDEPDLRDIVRRNLQLDGHEVAVAAEGGEALAALTGGMRPDVVLLDVSMPGIDGWEVLRRVKGHADPAVVRTPVVMMTGRSSELDRIRGGIEGAVRYLTKPVEMGSLSQVVTEALEADEAQARLAAQTAALQRLVRLERGEPVDADAGAESAGGRRVRFSRLERRPDPRPRPAPSPGPERSAPPPAALDLSRLSATQAKVLEEVGRHPSVRVASAQLGVSRSNVYASLRRIAAKLDVGSVHELVALARERAG